MGGLLDKCVKCEASGFKDSFDIEFKVVESNLRNSIGELFHRLNYGIIKAKNIDYLFDLYSLMYNVNNLIEGDNRNFRWDFLGQPDKVEALEYTNLETSRKNVANDISIIKDGFSKEFPINYQVAHPGNKFKCPAELKICHNQEDSFNLNFYINAYPAMEELLSGTYNLTSLRIRDLQALVQHECVGEQVLAAFFQDATAKAKVYCSELYDKISFKAKNNAEYVPIKEQVDQACSLFDSTKTWYDDKYVCVLRPAGCDAEYTM